MSTRMQMEIWDRKEAERKNIAYEQRIAELEEELMARERANVEVLSQHGSNSRQYATPTPERPTDEAHNAAQFEQLDNYAENEDYDHYEEDENFLPNRPNRHAAVCTTATNVRPSFPNDTHAEMQESLPPSRPVVAQSARNRTTAPPSDIHPYFPNDTNVATKESLLPRRSVVARLTEESLLPRRPIVARSTEESLLPPRTVAAQLARNMTTGSTNDILPCFANDTHARNEKALLPRRHDAAQSLINKTTTTTNDVPHLHDDFVKQCKKRECKKASSTPLKGTAGSSRKSLT